MDEQTLLREAQALTSQKMMAIVRQVWPKAGPSLAKSLIKQNGAAQGLMQVLLLSLSAHITQQLGMAPGGEFRAAYNASRDVSGCQLVLGDRPLHVTLKRALSSLNFFQKMKFFFHLLVSLRMDIKWGGGGLALHGPPNRQARGRGTLQKQGHPGGPAPGDGRRVPAGFAHFGG
jgi:hypothetical protein